MRAIKKANLEMAQPGKQGSTAPEASAASGVAGLGGVWSQSWPSALVPYLAPQAEYDAMLLEHAGEAIPALAAAAGGHAFAPFFATFLPLLLCKTVSALLQPNIVVHLLVHAVPAPSLLCRHADLYSFNLPCRNRAVQWQRSPLPWEPWQSPFRV